jgi:apolipoprotein N-acyltransferase
VERIKPAGLAVLSALLVLGAFPPFNCAPLLAVALVPWLLCLEGASSNKGAWKRGYLFGVVFGLGQLHWLEVLAETWTHNVALGMIPWVLAAAALAVYFGLVSMAARVCLVRGMVWLIPVVWAGMEVFRSYLPVVAFPWGLLATPLWKYPALVQEARLGTIYLCGAWIVALNLVVFLLVRRRPGAWAFGGAVVGLLAVSLILYQVGPAVGNVKVLVGQTGVDQAFDDPQQAWVKTHQVMNEMVKEAVVAGDAITVFPEGVARIGTDPAAVGFHLDPRAPTLFGAQRGEGTVYQSAVAYDGRFMVVDKTRLVIFGEFVPGRDYLPFLAAFHLPSGDLSSGEHGTQAVRMGRYVVGPLVCFEALFPDLAFRQAINGSQLLAVVSDDDWFMGSSAPEELKAGSVWRSIETGLPLLRSASLGYSVAVDGHGRVLGEAPLGRKFALGVSVPVPVKPGPVWFEPLFPLFSLLVLVGIPWIGRGRQSSSASSPDMSASNISSISSEVSSSMALPISRMRPRISAGLSGSPMMSIRSAISSIRSSSLR